MQSAIRPAYRQKTTSGATTTSWHGWIVSGTRFIRAKLLGRHGYKGINTRWVTQEGQRFEVQFHTPESFHAKQNVTHRAYERLRNLLTSDAERGELESFQREVSSRIELPEPLLTSLTTRRKGTDARQDHLLRGYRRRADN